MRYGCLPIVRVTGGLKDTVIPWQCETGEGNGFAFRDYNAQEMEECVYDVLDVYSDPAAMDKLVRNAMEADFSFERSAEKYVRLYISMLEKKASGRKK
jgi:starch synthase